MPICWLLPISITAIDPCVLDSESATMVRFPSSRSSRRSAVAVAFPRLVTVISYSISSPILAVPLPSASRNSLSRLCTSSCGFRWSNVIVASPVRSVSGSSVTMVGSSALMIMPWFTICPTDDDISLETVTSKTTEMTAPAGMVPRSTSIAGRLTACSAVPPTTSESG